MLKLVKIIDVSDLSSGLVCILDAEFQASAYPLLHMEVPPKYQVILETLRVISNQKYLKYFSLQYILASKNYWLRPVLTPIIKSYPSFWPYFRFWGRASFGWALSGLVDWCHAWSALEQSQCWTPISTVKSYHTRPVWSQITTRLGDWIGTIICLPVPWVCLTVPVCQKCTSMPWRSLGGVLSCLMSQGVPESHDA